MNTISLFQEVRDALYTSSKFCSLYSANDIGTCLYADIYDCKLIMDDDELNDLLQLYSLYTSKLSDSFAIRDNIMAASIVEDMIALLDELPEKELVEQINYDLTLKRHKEKKTIIAIGDSHINFFCGNGLPKYISIGNGINVCYNNIDNDFTALHLGPCLAYNSPAYGTENKFLEKAEWLFDNFFDKNERVIISLGEIDIRAHVFKETEKRNCSFEVVINDILDRYGKFLKNIKEKGYQVYVWGPIATRKDKYPNDDRTLPLFGTEIMRNMATEYFTERLSVFCNKEGIIFMSIYDRMVQNYWTDDSFLCEDHSHLSEKKYDIGVEIWKKAGLI